MGPGEIVQLVNAGGVAALTLVVLWFILSWGVRRKWVWGWQYDDMREERDEWKRLFMEGSNVAHRGAEVAEKVALVTRIVEAELAASQAVERERRRTP